VATHAKQELASDKSLTLFAPNLLSKLATLQL
jgi:hypothetical protein